MEIGRKIYYEKATGNVLVDTGERSGSVIETTIEQDFQTYAALAARMPATVGCIRLDYGQLASEFASYRYHVDPITESIVWDSEIGETLTETKRNKITQLNSQCNAAILAGFTSNALGTPQTYDFDYDAQINLGGMLNAITAGLVTGDVVWKASGIPQPHTIDQFKAVFAAGLSHKNAMIGHYWTLKDAVNSATTAEEIGAIVWNPVT